MTTNTDDEVQNFTPLQSLLGRQLCTAAALISQQKCCVSAPTVSIPEGQDEYLCTFRKYRDRGAEENGELES